MFEELRPGLYEPNVKPRDGQPSGFGGRPSRPLIANGVLPTAARPSLKVIACMLPA